MNKLNPEFLKRMDEELKANAHKGDWSSWDPSPQDILKEALHHLKKLEQALLLKDKEHIKEFSADVANICEKAFNLAERLN